MQPATQSINIHNYSRIRSGRTSAIFTFKVIIFGVISTLISFNCFEVYRFRVKRKLIFSLAEFIGLHISEIWFYLTPTEMVFFSDETYLVILGSVAKPPIDATNQISTISFNSYYQPKNYLTNSTSQTMKTLKIAFSHISLLYSVAYKWW